MTATLPVFIRNYQRPLVKKQGKKPTMLGKEGERCVVKLAKRQGGIKSPKQVLHCTAHVTTVTTRHKMGIK